MDQAPSTEPVLSATGMLDRPMSASPAPLSKSAVRDLWDGLRRPDLWGRLGWLEIKRRYRRTTIGPFWNVISLAVFVVTVGTVGAGLWDQSASQYLPFLTSGMLVWMMISASANESCVLFVANSHLYRNGRFDYSTLAYALVWRNFIVLLHHLVVYVLVVGLLAPGLIGPATLLAIPGLALLMINGVWVSLLLGMFCLRFRDVQQLVASVIQISLFMTPVFWPADQLGEGTARSLFIHFNPLYHAIQIVRAPLLGEVPALESYLAVILIAVIGSAVALWAFTRFRKRVTYWI